MRLWITLLLAFAMTSSVSAQLEPQFPEPIDSPVAQEEEMVTVQFPNSSAQEILTVYEQLTGKRTIRDFNLSGPNLSIAVPGPIPKEEAIALIEATMILNGYTFVEVDDNTVKILGQTKPPKSEGVPLYTDPIQLPDTDQIVSFFMPLRYIKNEDAKAIFEQYVQVRQFGSIVAVPNVNALVITENVPLVRRLIALREVIDVEGARTVTEVIALMRADAEKVQEILEQVFQPEEQGNIQPGQQAQQVVNQAPPAGQPDNIPPPTVPGVGNFTSALPAKVQVIADPRTNSLIVVAPEGRMPYIRNLVAQLDSAVQFDKPLNWPLRFANAGEVLPVLANLLAESDDDPQESSTASSGSQSGSGGGAGAGGGEFAGGGSSTKPDLLTDPTESTAPESVVVGKSRIIADRSANAIIVFGPPESRTKAASVLAMLDQRPKQIYLAVVIGQLALGDGVEFGIDYLMRFGDVRILGQGETAGISNLLANRSATVDLLPDTDDVIDTATDVAGNVANSVARNALPVVSGLTVFGTIADSVDFVVRALGTDNRFEVISRPMIYTVNNKKAVISSGQQVPVPTSTLTSVVDNTVNNTGTAVTSNIEFKDVVLKLEVIPLVNSPHEVTLKIAQQNDNLQGNVSISGNSVPIIGTQELRTTVTVPNRHTVILGGLITDQETLSQTGIPYLKDIPYVGYLFGNTRRDVQRRELIVMIQPYIINSDFDMADVNTIERTNVSFKPGSLYEEAAPPSVHSVKPAVLPVERYEIPKGPVPVLIE